jgi:hypothetical protein
MAAPAATIAARGRKEPPRAMPLELVDETVDQEIDVDRLHDLVATLLVRRYRQGQALIAEGG